MRQLFIDNKLAVMSESNKFTLHRENPYFTNSGDYTLEVSLPLRGCLDNQKIFGSIYRTESKLAPFVGKKYPFRLITPPLFIAGNAVITSISENDVKIQLLAGTSGFNSDTIEEKGEDIYIDEMNLGKAYEDRYPQAYADGDRFFDEATNRYYSPRNKIISALYSEKDKSVLYGLNGRGKGHTDCVNFPVWSETDSAMTNEKMLHRVDMANKPIEDRFIYNILSPSAAYGEEVHFAAQPYLVNLVEKVVENLGYKVKSNAIRGTWMENIFVANAKNEYKFNRILPHWTVKEFLQEIRQFFGVFFFVEGKNVEIISRNSFYERIDNFVHLDEIVDEYTAELSEDDDSQDVSSGNIGYDHPSMDDMLSLPDEVWENAIIVKKPTEQILLTWIQQNIKEADKEKSAWIFVDEQTGNTYAYLQSSLDSKYYLAQVDCCPPLIRRGNQYSTENRDIDIALRIVPAKMAFRNIDFSSYIDKPGQHEQKVYPNQIALPMLITDNSRESYLNIFSVDAAINTQSQKENKENDLTCIEVALNTDSTFRAMFDNGHGSSTTADIPMAVGIGYVLQKDGFYTPVICAGNNNEFKMTNKKAPSLFDSVLNSNFKIDTRCKHIFYFIDDVAISPNKIFVIRGKRYACEKIDYTVGPDGVEKMKRGYFYEIN